MPWVPLEQSGQQYQLQGTPGASLANSIVTVDSGTPPVDPISEFFVLQFPNDGQREGFQMRATMLSYQDTGATINASKIGTLDDPEALIKYQVYENTAGPDSWSPNPMEFSVQFDTGKGVRLTNAFPEEFNAQTFQLFVEVFVDGPPPVDVSYNCECDDDYPRTTLGDMRKRLLRRLGFAAQANNPPPGMADLLDDFIQQAQEMLFRRYSVFRRERWFTWDLIPGTRFYDLDANADECTKRLEPRMITWAGISQGDDSWRPLVCGIDPVMYSSRGPGIPSHYEIRQCIELWPAPSDATWKLRIKGQFGLLPLVAATDSTSIDPEAIFLLALANAKAHYGQPDAGNYATQLTTYIRDLVRGSHMTRRYFPGEVSRINDVRPSPVDGWPESRR